MASSRPPEFLRERMKKREAKLRELEAENHNLRAGRLSPAVVDFIRRVADSKSKFAKEARELL